MHRLNLIQDSFIATAELQSVAMGFLGQIKYLICNDAHTDAIRNAPPHETSDHLTAEASK